MPYIVFAVGFIGCLISFIHKEYGDLLSVTQGLAPYAKESVAAVIGSVVIARSWWLVLGMVCAALIAGTAVHFTHHLKGFFSVRR